MNVTAKLNILHNGQLYEAGQSFEVTDKQAADLLAAGSINPVPGLRATEPEEAPDRSIDTPDDKNAINENTSEVANLPIKMNMKKTVLRGIALANGLEVAKTATPSEIFNIIKEYRTKNNIVVENTTGGAEKKEDEGTDESGAEAPVEGAEATTGGEPEVPANPNEDATAQNTTDTEKEPAPTPSKSK